MNAIFWVGLVLGGVVGLGVDLWKRPLDRLLDRRIDARATTRAVKLSRRLANDRQGLRDFLMVQILETTLIGSLGAILSGLLFTAPSIMYSAFGLGSHESEVNQAAQIFTILGQIVAVVTAGMIVRIASDAISVARKVADFRFADITDQPVNRDASLQATENPELR